MVPIHLFALSQTWVRGIVGGFLGEGGEGVGGEL